MSIKPFLPDEDGIKTFWSDENGGSITSVADVSEALEANKQAYNWNDGYSKSREMRRVAFIPEIIRQKWLNEEGWDAFSPQYADRLARKLNDPEWRYLRTAPGTVAYKNGRIR